MKTSYKFEISGLVQGVGFRPFIYTLALRYELFGDVYNDDSGVKINIYGDENKIKNFKTAIFNELPNLARIDEFKEYKTDLKFSEFKIIESKQDKKMAPILPDFALCADCENEFNDPKNLRYKYPFINCTNCGPRFSIIKALPYDRKHTTMSVFKMCESCNSEYKNPLDRRYHAQPISCPSCGPTISFKILDKSIISINNEAIKTAANLINEGKILAIKGLGGFHLVCSAYNENTIEILRERKRRPHKPFAVMSKDIKTAKTHAEISKYEEKLLTSNLKPIVLLKAKSNSKIAKNVAPNLNKIGIMLPFSGIHLALFEYLKCDIIATSANISGEPVIYDEIELLKKLSHVLDGYLDHDRTIHSPSDDSIAFVLGEKPHFIRTSRGLNPQFINTKFKKKGTFLALGAELKNQFAIYHDGLVMISPYIGDLKNVATFDRFLSVLKLFETTYELSFDVIVADLHPHFLNLKYAKENFKNIVQVQHHHAHLLSVIFENNLQQEKKYIGFCFDGTGFGTDGKIWGGEVLKISGNNHERLCKFDEFLLLGGENSIKNIYQLAYSIILKYELEEEASAFLSKFDEKKLKNLKLLAKNSPSINLTSSLGRVFDAFASVIIGLNEVTYEGQSGMELEALYDENLDIALRFEVKNGVINFKNAFKEALNLEPKVAATGFINGLAILMLDIAKEQNLDVLLSGGVFQNSTLLAKVDDKFSKNGIKYYTNQRFCSNDSGVCMGQLLYALNSRS